MHAYLTTVESADLVVVGITLEAVGEWVRQPYDGLF